MSFGKIEQAWGGVIKIKWKAAYLVAILSRPLWSNPLQQAISLQTL